VGDLLQSMGIEFSVLTYLLPAMLTLVLVLHYPSRQRRYAYRNFYRTRKTYDLLLATSTFLLIMLTGNGWNSGAAVSAVPAAHATSISVPGHASSVKPVKKIKKSLRKILQDFRKKYRDADDTEKVLLIILTVLVAIALVFLLAALACSIACAGAEALALILVLVGLGGIIWGAVSIIKKISRKKKKEPQIRSS
jgi:hypothetical protein